MLRSQRIRSALAAVAFCLPFQALSAQETLESLTWDLVSVSGDTAKLEAFLETYPDSIHAEEARAQLEEIAAKNSGYFLEEEIFELIGNVTYTTPMAFGNEEIIGRSLSEITELSPLYPPVEGLPEEIWKNQTCENCHSWTRADLCVQATTYVSMEPSQYREKLHPFGGMLKVNLRNWAQNGCE